MESSARFWDKIADRYSRQPVADEASYQNKLKITQSYLQPDMDVVELGLGPAVHFFGQDDLETCIKRHGFEIEHSWKPGKRKAVFVVARKSG